MHLGGRIHLDTARRLWPGWTERMTAAQVRATDRAGEPARERRPALTAIGRTTGR